MQIKAYGRTDKGLVRESNEDSILIGENLYVVSDGMGGYSAGEVASNYTVSILEDELENLDQNLSQPKLKSVICRAYNKVNTEVRKKARTDENCKNMGATAASFVITGRLAALTWVGDSCIYRLRDKKLKKLTEDHKYAKDLFRLGSITKEEYDNHPDKHVISRAIGFKPEVNPEFVFEEIEAGDQYILCTDGLSGFVSDTTIEKILNEGLPPKETIDKLIASAFDNKSDDNVTVLLVTVRKEIDSKVSIKKTGTMQVPTIAKTDTIKANYSLFKVWLVFLGFFARRSLGFLSWKVVLQ